MLSQRVWKVLLGIVLVCSAVVVAIGIGRHEWDDVWIMSFLALTMTISYRSKPWERRRRSSRRRSAQGPQQPNEQ
jgi:hypothetical protein